MHITDFINYLSFIIVVIIVYLLFTRIIISKRSHLKANTKTKLLIKYTEVTFTCLTGFFVGVCVVFCNSRKKSFSDFVTS